MKIFTENKERWITGLLLLAVTLFVGYIDNKTLSWLFLGAFYIVGFNEAVKLFDVISFQSVRDCERTYLNQS